MYLYIYNYIYYIYKYMYIYNYIYIYVYIYISTCQKTSNSIQNLRCHQLRGLLEKKWFDKFPSELKLYL